MYSTQTDQHVQRPRRLIRLARFEDLQKQERIVWGSHLAELGGEACLLRSQSLNALAGYRTELGICYKLGYDGRVFIRLQL